MSKPRVRYPKFHWWSEMFKSMRRTPYQGIVAILALGFTFYALTIFALLAGASEIALRVLEAKPQVTVFFSEGKEPSAQQVDQIKQQLQNMVELEEFRFISQQQAWEIYTGSAGENTVLLQYVTPDNLPASIEVSTKNAADLSRVADFLTTLPNVDDIYYEEEVIAQLTKWTRAVRRIGLENILFLSLLSFLFIFIVMGMKIAMRRSEIQILKLVGASRGFITKPLILEGMMYGALGALLGFGAAFTRLLYAVPMIIELIGNLNWEIISSPWVWQLFVVIIVGELIIGSTLAGLASWWAVNRYLKRF